MATSSHHTIILRTVCGCERMLAIPNRELPREWRVAYLRNPYLCLTTDDPIDRPVAFKIRVFERTLTRGNYGYPIYLERIDA